MIFLIQDGVKYKILSGDANDFHRQLPSIKADIAGMRVVHTGEQKWFHRKDRWDIKEAFGETEVVIYGGVKKEKRIRKIERKKDIELKYPVLGIRLRPIGGGYGGAYLKDIYQENTVPLEDGKPYYIDKDVDERRVADRTHKRLQEVGNWGYGEVHDAYPHVDEVTYPDWEDDKILLTRDFAYQNIWCGAHTYYWVRPQLFTCGDYEAVTICPTVELWEHYDEGSLRAITWVRHYWYHVYIDDVEYMSVSEVRNYELSDYYFVEEFDVTPEHLAAHGWTEEEVGDICVPFDTYNLWYRGTWGVGDSVGEELYVEQYVVSTGGPEGPYEASEYGAGKEEQPYEYKEWVAFICAHYDIFGTQSYDYQLRLYVGHRNTAGGYDLEEHLLLNGPNGYYTVADDVWVSELRMYNFHGKPVVVWAYVQFDYDTPSGYFYYGMWYNGKVTQTEGFREDFYDPPNNWSYLHKIFTSLEDEGLYSMGEVCAFGIYRPIEGNTIVTELEEYE